MFPIQEHTRSHPTVCPLGKGDWILVLLGPLPCLFLDSWDRVTFPKQEPR